MRNILKPLEDKIQPANTAADRIAQWKSSGLKVVFTNGCFDILHKGHVTYLAKAAELGDRLVVALNTDQSVRRLEKGEERPVNPEEARSAVIASLGFVDLVVVFNEDTPLQLIRQLQPDILVKGADYDAHETDPASRKYIQGKKEVEAFGGRVATIPLVHGFSTTGIVQKLRRK